MRGKKKKTDEEFFQQHTGNASFGSARGTGKGTKKHVQNKNKAVCEWDDELESEMVQA
jgi:hypothetical protein